jgi:hypothetical protein
MLDAKSDVCRTTVGTQHEPSTAPGVAERRRVALRVLEQLPVVRSDRGRNKGENGSGNDGSAHDDWGVDRGWGSVQNYSRYRATLYRNVTTRHAGTTRGRIPA